MSDIVLRIDYILKINNFVKDESKTINDIDFLQEQIMYNELIESLKEKLDDNVIEGNLLDIKLKLKNTINNIKLSYQDREFEDMWQNLSKLRFYINNINELIKMRNK